MSTPSHSHLPATPGNSDDRRCGEPRQYVRQRSAFRVHTAVFAAGVVAILLVNVFPNIAAEITSEWSAWWTSWALIGWALATAEAVGYREDQTTREATSHGCARSASHA